MMPDKPIAEEMQVYAEMARKFAEEFDRQALDYSDSSLEGVDHILGRLHNDLPKGFFARLFKHNPSQESIAHISAIFGAYVGEVIRRRWGGEWQQDHPMQRGLPALVVMGQTLAPSSKAYKRIVDGPEDNIVFYYQTLCTLINRQQDK